MMCYWENIATSSKTGQGQITIGGFVTYLARYLGVTGFHNLTLSGGLASFDIDRIRQAKFVEKVGDTYFWIIGLHHLPMPLNKPPVDITRHSTFLYYRIREDEEEEESLRDDAAEPHAEEGAHMPPMRDGAGIDERSGRVKGSDETDIGRERRRRRQRREGTSIAESTTPEDLFGGRPYVDLCTNYDMMVGMKITIIQMSDHQRSMEVRQIVMQEHQMAIQAQHDQMSQYLGVMYN